jgi:hypothetical protein
MTLEIKTADELINPELEARWAARRAARHTEVLQRILRRFVDQGGPVPVAEVMAGFPGQSPETVRSEEHLRAWRAVNLEIAGAGATWPRGSSSDGGSSAVCSILLDLPVTGRSILRDVAMEVSRWR